MDARSTNVFTFTDSLHLAHTIAQTQKKSYKYIVPIGSHYICLSHFFTHLLTNTLASFALRGFRCPQIIVWKHYQFIYLFCFQCHAHRLQVIESLKQLFRSPRTNIKVSNVNHPN